MLTVNQEDINMICNRGNRLTAMSIEANGSHNGKGIINHSKTLNTRFQRILSFPSFWPFDSCFQGTIAFASPLVYKLP